MRWYHFVIACTFGSIATLLIDKNLLETVTYFIDLMTGGFMYAIMLKILGTKNGG